MVAGVLSPYAVRMSSVPHRYMELDLLRTCAVFCMIIYHAAYDLAIFYHWKIPLSSPAWMIFQRGTAGLFVLLVGISFAISWDRHRAKSTTRYPLKYLYRGLGLLACGLAVTAVTFLIDPHTYVRFGILHLIGTTILLLPLFAPMRRWNMIISLFMFLLSSAIHHITLTTPFLLPLGIPYLGFHSVDYFPLLPWFGVALMGYVIGDTVYVRGKAVRQSFPLTLHTRWAPILTWPGRHALLLYLLHQPLLLCIWTLVLGFPDIN